MADVTPARAAACPRCGYDLRGAVAGWAECCPLAGTCTECGLELEWGLLLNPALQCPRWCVEYSNGAWGLPRRAARTLVRSFRPWSFWRALRMTDEIRWRRLAGYVAVLAVGLYAAFTVAHTVLAYGVVGGVSWKLYTSTGTIGPVTVGWYDCILAGLTPLSGSAIGGATESSFGIVTSYWNTVLVLGAVLGAGHWMCAAGFVALPLSLRMARVRFAHVHRIALYGMALLLPPILLRLAGIALSHQTSLGITAAGDLLNDAADWCAWAVIPAEIAWWSVATGCYLRMPHAWAVGAAVVTMASLTAAAALTWIALSVA